ncbi:MAG TPA: alginate export family protein [Smithella sp.]|nr:alginate export family protein [Smithella sp.]
MKGNAVLKVLMITAVCLFFAISAYAEVKVDYGVTFRLRQETWDNLFDMNYNDSNSASGAPVFTRNDDVYWRLKTTPWFRVALDKKYFFYAKLVNEARYFNTSSSETSRPNGWNKDEIDFDNLYIAANNFLGLPMDITIGRQDFLGVFGDGLLVMDGTPGDGSKTYYFNAARALIKFNDRYNLDLVYLFAQDVDEVLPSLYSAPKRSLNTSDEIGAIVYGRGKILDSLTLEPYYMYKEENQAGYPSALKTQQLTLHTVGMRAVLGLGGWKARGEFAYQFGEYNNKTDRRAEGGNVFLGYKFESVTFKPAFEAGYIYLSGDDPNTTKVEGWDPLWSRWPWMSELYVLSYGVETGIVGYWTNLQMARLSGKVEITPKTALEVVYNRLWANENVTGPIFSGDGKNRGDLVQAKLSHKFTDKLDGYLLIEDFMPGDFYKDTNRDNAMFVRWELQWKI